ncbi:MAG: aldo/keto reductase [Bdellovibrionaceae bacterium]|nr:aldo/keto reductase [Pseudobdellovibrionaceae bacterium]
MRLSLTIFAILALCSTGYSDSSAKIRQIASDDSEMEYVEICRNEQKDGGPKTDCRKFSRLILGTDHVAAGNWTREGQQTPSEDDVRKLFTEAARLGINTFDTSPIYVENVENKLGKWIKDNEEQIKKPDFYKSQNSNPDKKLYVISKGGFPFDLFYLNKLPPGDHSKALKDKLTESKILQNPTPDSWGWTNLHNVPPGTYASRLFGTQTQIKGNISEELGHSLPQLNNNITIYLMHRDDGDFLNFARVERPQTPVQTIMNALSDSQIRERYWMVGWSNWTTERVNESLKLATENPNLTQPVLNSPYFSLFEMSDQPIHAGGIQVTHAEMMNPDFQKGIKFMPYSPLGGFSILDKEKPVWEKAKAHAKRLADSGDAYWKNVYSAVFTSQNEARFNRVNAFTQKYNDENQTTYSVDQMINAYALAHDRMDFLTIGAITIEQLHRSVEALKLSKKLKQIPGALDYLYQGN